MSDKKIILLVLAFELLWFISTAGIQSFMCPKMTPTEIVKNVRANMVFRFTNCR